MILLIPLALMAAGAAGQDLRYEISGIADPLLANVQSHLNTFRIASGSGYTRKQVERERQDAEERARAALLPFGFYHADISGEISEAGDGEWIIRLVIEPGPPVVVANANIEVIGDGAGLPELVAWRSGWSLTEGRVLDQTVWGASKRAALQIASTQGYLQGQFVEHAIELDLDNNSAVLNLRFDTGPRSAMGTINYDQQILRPHVLDNIPRFETGDPYTADLLQQYRNDLWKTGYFTDVEVVERRRDDAEPPVVDLDVKLTADTRNTYEGSVGFGTDTEFRLEAGWSRHPVSTYGDHIDVAVGWQQFNEELLLRTTYRIPRRSAVREYWIGELLLKSEHQDFEIKVTPEDEDTILLAGGPVGDTLLRAGRLKVRNQSSTGDQWYETLFVQYLTESTSLDLIAGLPPELVPRNPDIDFAGRIKGTRNTLALGVEYDRPALRGKGFQTSGRRDRFHALGSSEAWGSELGFLQLYATTRRSYVLGDRWKFLLRAEVGYTDAKADRFDVDVGGQPVSLSLTRLPDLYRFKAGGSKSVRGYGFEELSDNLRGSNNILTASAEGEFRFLDNWSAAAFVDIGNAFNDWDDPELKKGAGFGIRWYTIAGAIRVDVARALDFEGKPWRLHLTIGTPLL